MKKVQQLFMLVGIIYSTVVAILIIQLKDTSWKNSHSYYIAFMTGLLIIYNASRSLFKMKKKGVMV